MPATTELRLPTNRVRETLPTTRRNRCESCSDWTPRLGGAISDFRMHTVQVMQGITCHHSS